MKKVSLSIKIALFSIAAMVVCASVGIVTTVLVNNNTSKSIIDNRLGLSVSESSQDINDAFIRVETVTDEVKMLAENRITTTNDLNNHAETIQDPLNTLRDVFHLGAGKTDFVCGYWIYLNPEYTGQTSSDEHGDGFYWIKNESNTFVNHPMVNVLKYSEENVENVGWWYECKKANSAIWMDPYYNANVNRNMISYTIPFFSSDSKFLGAIGVDLDFKNIVEIIESHHEFKTGHQFLLNKEHLLLSHPEYSNLDENGHYHSEGKYLTDIIDANNAHLHPGVTYSYKYKGTPRLASFVMLNNDWVFGLSATKSEMNESINASIAIPIIVYSAVTIMLSIILIVVVRYLLSPVKELNEAITRVTYGDLDVHVMSKHNDEIGQLTNSFEEMILNLRSERSAMNALAFQDGLTGVKNKAAQEEKVAELNAKIKNGTARFAVVMCDVDDLKLINDNQGHVRGDQAIRGACLALCHCFSHSAVYRIGGDEFVAILESKDYDNRNALFAKIQKENLTDESGQYHFSVGMAVFKQGIDANYQSVYNRADENMYEMKNKTKGKK